MPPVTIRGMTATDATPDSLPSVPTPAPHAWPALDAARRRAQPRVDWAVLTPAGWVPAGSVPQAAVERLLHGWPADFVRLPGERLGLRTMPEQRPARLTEVGLALRDEGWVRAWRDEPYPLWSDDGQATLLAIIERATARFWGALTLGAHCNGYVADAAGRPTHLWIARRAWDKPTDPGRLDNLIGGGVPQGQTPRQALLREAWEEAGLAPDEMAGLQCGRVLTLDCDLPEGLQREWLHVYDLALPAGRVPVNQDGEVAEHRLMSVDAALAVAADGQMTTDASLSTLDFALRHGLLPAPQAAALASRLTALCVPAERAGAFDPP